MMIIPPGKDVFYIEPCRDDDEECREGLQRLEEQQRLASEAAEGRDVALRPIYHAFDERMKNVETGELDYFIKTVPGKAVVFTGDRSNTFPTGTYFSTTGKYAKAFRHFVLNKECPSAFALFEVFDDHRHHHRRGVTEGETSGNKKRRFESVESFKEHCKRHSATARMLLANLSDAQRSKYPEMTTHDDLDSWEAFVYPPPKSHPETLTGDGDGNDGDDDDDGTDLHRHVFATQRSGLFYLTKTSRLKKNKLKCFVCVKSTAGPFMERTMKEYIRKENKNFDLKEYARMAHDCCETSVRNCCRVAYLLCGACRLDGNFEKEHPDPTFRAVAAEKEMEREENGEFFSYPVRCVPTFVQYYNAASVQPSVATGGGGGGGDENLLISFNATVDVTETGRHNGCKIMAYVSESFVSIPVDPFYHAVPIAPLHYSSLEELEKHKGALAAMHVSESEMNEYLEARKALEATRSSSYAKYFGPHSHHGKVAVEDGGYTAPPHPLHLKFYEIHNV